MLRFEIISIGNELLSGKVLNSNAAFLGEELAKHGYPVAKVTVISDSDCEIEQAIESAWQRAEVTVVTGGLGPTHDDVTRESLLKFFKVKPVLHQKSLENIRRRLTSLGRSVTADSEKQAFIPENSTAIFNPEGTAPGFTIQEGRKRLIVLPGVPYECKKMFRESVLPAIKSNYSPVGGIHKMRLRTAGIGEGQIFRVLDRMQWLADDVQVSFLPNLDGVDIDIDGQEENFLQTVERMEKTLQKYIYSDSHGGSKSLGEATAALLNAQKMRLSVAESCSGGLLASFLTDIPGSSQYFQAGVVSYSNRAKIDFLGVSTETIRRFGAVSSQCAREMAAGVCRNTGSDIGLATTGIAGPTGQTPLKPLGLVYIAYADRNKCLAEKFIFPNGRDIHKQRTARTAVTMLWQQLRSYR